MASDWDKYCKLRSEFPKPKSALDASSRQLKKKPNDPYLLTVKAEALLGLDGRAKEALSILSDLCQRQPPVTDLHLLRDIYSHTLDASRQLDPGHSILSSVGIVGQKAWQNAAKLSPNRKAKLRVWSDLFVVALKAGCWEDVGWATMQAKQLGGDSKHKRSQYYTMILANQLDGEVKAKAAKAAGKDDPGNQLPLTLAYRRMKEAYNNSPKPTDEDIQVANMGDLRFMGEIYARQNRLQELYELWTNPPPTVAKFVNGAIWDFNTLLIDLARRQSDWIVTEKACYNLLDQIFKVGSHDPAAAGEYFFNICVKNWTMWRCLFDSTAALYPWAQGQAMIIKVYTDMLRYLPAATPNTYRAQAMTALSLNALLGTYSLLVDVKSLYQNCYRSRTCFKDLRRFVVCMPVHEQRDFHAYISEHAQGLGAKITDEGTSEDVKMKIREWHETEETVLKFEFLMIVSLPKAPNVTVVEAFVGNALRLWRLQLDAEGSEEASTNDSLLVAVEALIHLFDATLRPHYLYQAATLTRYALSLDIHHNGRSIALLSSRLHSKLGLGTYAFEHYSRVKAKEMLNDNIAWVVLSRISQSHPFGAGGPKSFSAEVELDKVIKTITRMEEKTDDMLYANMQQFAYNNVFDLLELKGRLRTSLTKQFCSIEKRRISRLSGKPVDMSSDLPWKDLDDISDNCDWDALPGITYTMRSGMNYGYLRSPITKLWVYDFRSLNDVVSSIVYKEKPSSHIVPPCRTLFVPELARERNLVEDNDTRKHCTQNEESMELEYWQPMQYILQQIFPTETLPMVPKLESIRHALNAITRKLQYDKEDFERDCQKPPSTSVDKMPHFTEDSLHATYGRLEVLRALNRLPDFLRPISKSTTDPLRKEVSMDECNTLQDTVSEVYGLHRNWIKVSIDRLRRYGTAHIRKLILHGATGEAIDRVIGDETLSNYCRDYVESADEALNGALRVELG